MNKVDKVVGIVVAVLLGCVLVKTALDAAASLILPVLIAAVVYAGFRAWQKGLFSRLAPKKPEGKAEEKAA